MRLTIKQIAGVTVVAVIGIVTLAACTSNSVGADEAIQQRKALMKTIFKNWKPIKAYAKSGKGSAADVVKYAKAINASADKIPGLFPKGTSRGDYPDTVTRALPAIWKDWTGFEKAAKNLEAQSATLVKVAMGGDKDAITKQIGVMGKNSCGVCHKPFRGKKVKK